MSANTPIPLDTFTAALESLDSDEFAALVGETYAATADGVAVDAPRVTVRTGSRRTEILVVPAATESVSADSVDAVAVASDAPLDDLGSGLDADVVTPAELRQRLLYAVPPAEANAIADRLLDVPVRSAAYDGTAGSDAEAADGEGDGVTDVDGEDDDGSTDADGTVDDGAATAGVAPGGAGGDGASSPRPTDRTAADSADDSRSRDRPGESAAPADSSGGTTAAQSAADAPTERRDRRTALAAVAVIALLVAAAGAGFAAGAGGIGGPGGLAGVGDSGTSAPSATDSDAAGATNGSDGESEGSTGDDDAANTVAVAAGDPTGEADRNTALSPTCERSALQVVQIQMNALRYNDNGTNDGIRTVRAFASPENKELVGSIGQYVELFETEQYGPMLTYDTVRYSVPEIDGDTAAVEVVTRENGSVTGRYEFLLVRVGGGSGSADGSLGDVDDCWMTDAVAASTE